MARALAQGLIGRPLKHPSQAKLLFLIDDFGQGGAQRQLSLLLPEFVRRGYRVTAARYGEHAFLAPQIESSGVEVVRLAGSSRLAWLRSFIRLSRRIEPDVIAAFLKGPSAMALSARLITRTRVPLVVCERSLDPLGRPSGKARLVRWLYGWSDGIACNSRAQRDRLGSYSQTLRSKAHYIGNAVDLEAFPRTPHPTGEIRKVAVLGRAHEEKGLDVLVQALSMHSEERSNPTRELPMIQWYGQGWNEVGSRYPDRPLPPGIEFLPPVQDVPDLIAGVDALLVPSLSEGTPNVVLESMSSGRPVIATTVGDIPYMIRDGVNGWLINPGSPAEIISGLIRAMSVSGKQLHSMCDAARAAAEDLADLSLIVDQYEDYFSRIASRS